MKMDYLTSYNLESGKKMYFSPSLNRFWINKKPKNIIPQYNDISVSEMRLEITYLCNGNCRYCIVYGNEIERMGSIKVAESWEWFLKQPWFNKIKKIFIIGGEPLIHFDDISFILDHFEGEVRFSTNGTLITPPIAKKLAKHNVLVYISLDGPNYEDNLMRTYQDGHYMYNDIIRGLNLLVNEGVKYGFFMVSTRENVKKIVEVISQLDEKFSPLRIGYSLPHWTNNFDNEVSAEEYSEALQKLYKNRKRIKAEIMQVNWRIRPLWQGKVRQFSCALHTSQITVLPDKRIVRCSKLDNDPILKEITNKELDNNCPVALAERGENPCLSCIALGSCGGGCPFDGLKRFDCIIDRRECVITPPLINMAIQDIIAVLNTKESISDGLIDTKMIKEILA